MTGLDQWRGAEIDVADMRKHADGGDQSRTNKPDGDNL